jgi:hypothetical protein
VVSERGEAAGRTWPRKREGERGRKRKKKTYSLRDFIKSVALGCFNFCKNWALFCASVIENI